MATTVQNLINRVRTNINEPQTSPDPQRLDSEIARWLQDGQMDYIQKIPADAVPELIKRDLASGSFWSIPADYLRLLHLVVKHTVQGVTLDEQACVLQVDEVYATLFWPGNTGAWAQFRENRVEFGPSPISAVVHYLRCPADLTDCEAEFELRKTHEEPIVNYATAQALTKINDADVPIFLKRYEERVAAENARYYQPLKAEKV